MKPIFALPGEISPGVLGPTKTAPCARAAARTSMASSTGISSAVATTSLQPHSSASSTAPSTAAGGTNTIAVSAPVFSFASLTLANTGTSPTMVPARPGDTPATMLVPYLRASSTNTVPIWPVTPCTSTRLLRSSSMLMRALPPAAPPRRPPPRWTRDCARRIARKCPAPGRYWCRRDGRRPVWCYVRSAITSFIELATRCICVPPPNTLTRMTLTAGSASSIANAGR